MFLKLVWLNNRLPFSVFTCFVLGFSIAVFVCAFYVFVLSDFDGQIYLPFLATCHSVALSIMPVFRTVSYCGANTKLVFDNLEMWLQNV